ncbi:centrosomal protein of 68 kDa-like isoform X2 [Polyodon spathula]|uniref:centrosomal protein of 68 kDa-like isoform X2 n=1 Tax=Polyodon spathula TaxID=7913 RepID=UPI001B7F17FC|nr:centrosomal protein of 68 kDa-like isoform X2 [Polyodon spathula]
MNDNTDCGSPHQGLYEPATSHAASYFREGHTSYQQTDLKFDSRIPWSSRRCFSSPPLGEYSSVVKMSPRGLSAPRPSSVEASNPYSLLSKKSTSQVWKSLNTATRSGRFLHHNLDEPLDSKHNREKCPYQADYWACAIPSSLPPSPNRKSPQWDPDDEYRVLLDYTYPLSASHSHSRGRSDGDPIVSDPLLQDSGIELDDSFCFSTVNTLGSTVCLECNTEVLIKDSSATESPFSGKGLLPSGPEFKEPSHLKLGFAHQQHVGSSRKSISPYSSVDHVDLSLENSNCSTWFELHSKKFEQRMWHRKYGVFSSASSKPCFIPTTQILPPHKAWDNDEEYLSLPLRLKELEVLSQQLNTIAVQISKPGDMRCETQSVLEKDTASSKALYNQAEPTTGKGIADAGALFDTQTIKEDCDLENDLQSADGELTISRLKTVSYFMEQLGGLSLFEFEKKTQIDPSGGETKESLMQHIQTFCYKLGELIQWLYKVAEQMNNWNPPAPDIDSVKTSLDVYKKFQKEVDEHQPLTTAVLKTGEILLGCMSSTFPVLKETLGLVEKQSQALDKHAEHLYSSILTAMDIIRDEVLTKSDLSGDSTVDSVEGQQLNESRFVEQDPEL